MSLNKGIRSGLDPAQVVPDGISRLQGGKGMTAAHARTTCNRYRREHQAMPEELRLRTQGPGLYEITDDVAALVAAGAEGVLTLFVRHTSCSLLIQENADRDARRDLTEWLGRLVPQADTPGMGWIRHRSEGPDDMPAHIKAAILPVSLSIPVADGRMVLGTWQGIYLVEHRDAPHDRKVAAHLL